MNSKEKRLIIDLIKNNYSKAKGNYCIPLAANCPDIVSSRCPVYLAGLEISKHIDSVIPQGQTPNPGQIVDLLVQSAPGDEQKATVSTNLDTITTRFTFQNCSLQLNSKIDRTKRRR